MSKALFWFRRDLRVNDNAGLYRALAANTEVIPLFIFDTEILNDLSDKTDARVSFIHHCVTYLHSFFAEHNCNMQILYGNPLECIPKLCEQLNVYNIYTNHDYEPYAIQRDNKVNEYLTSKGGALHHYKDQVIFEQNEVVKDDGGAYTVFTPYSKKWKAKLNDYYLKPYPCHNYLKNLSTTAPACAMISLAQMGFKKTSIALPSANIDENIIKNYHNTRDIPSIQGTTRLSLHLRFGTISVRHLARIALSKNEKYLNELIWRDFYQQILWHFPHVVGNSFKPQYDKIKWRTSDEDFQLWCQGKTGYPLVDAGMRELNATGWMHNRVRMVVASFLTKHLLLNWRLGEAYFAEKLIDFELASNNGGWQWAAGSGVDAAPYFRIFNPHSQLEKFDKQLEYVKKWVPEYNEITYKPMIDHAFARERCLNTYKAALKNEG